MTNVPRKPVFFRRPENWDSMSDEEKATFAEFLLDHMGMPKDDGSK